MIFGYTVIFNFNRELLEDELDSFIKDLWSFKTLARQSGSIFGKLPNYIFAVYNETLFNTLNDKFSGNVRLYFETEKPVVEDINDISIVAQKFDAEIIHFSCKLKVGDSRE